MGVLGICSARGYFFGKHGGEGCNGFMFNDNLLISWCYIKDSYKCVLLFSANTSEKVFKISDQGCWFTMTYAAVLVHVGISFNQAWTKRGEYSVRFWIELYLVQHMMYYCSLLSEPSPRSHPELHP